MKKQMGLAIAAAGLGLLLAACDSTDGGGSISKDSLVGKWVINREVTTGAASIKVGTHVTQMPIDDDTTYTNSPYFLQLNADNSYSDNLPDDQNPFAKISAAHAIQGTDAGTWSVSGSTVTLVSTSGDNVSLKADISGNSGTFAINFTDEGDFPGVDSTGAPVTQHIVINVKSTAYVTK